MIKKLTSVIVAVLALNFLLAAGGVGYLVATKKLDKAKVAAIREIIVGKSDAAATQPSTTQPTTDAQDSPPDTPMVRLERMLATASGRPAKEQVEASQAAFEQSAAVLDARLHELENQRKLIEQVRAEAQKERETLTQQQKALADQQQAQTKLAQDEGFQKALTLYKSMPAKRVKAMFGSLDDTTVVRYLQAMEPRQAANVLKEFKTPAETERAKALLEKVRQAQQAAKAD